LKSGEEVSHRAHRVHRGRKQSRLALLPFVIFYSEFSIQYSLLFAVHSSAPSAFSARGFFPISSFACGFIIFFSSSASYAQSADFVPVFAPLWHLRLPDLSHGLLQDERSWVFFRQRQDMAVSQTQLLT